MRARRKQKGLANLHYLRFGNFYIIIATHGVHRFFAEEAKCVHDIRRRPIFFMGYSIGCWRERGGGKLHASVRINRDIFKALKARYEWAALECSVEQLFLELRALVRCATPV